jgi:hemerythrin
MGQSLPWSANYAIGHAELDAQHRGLVDLINNIDSAVSPAGNPGNLANLLRSLRAAAVEHIRSENAVLWEISSGTYQPLRDRPRTPHFLKAMAEAAFDTHIAEHDVLLGQLDAIIGGPVDALREALKAWFVDHAIKHDAHLKTIFQAM